MDPKNSKFQNLYREFQPVICKFFLKRGLTPEEAQDLTQATFLNAYKGLDDFRHNASLKTWLFQIARNVWRSRFRVQSFQKNQGDIVPFDQGTEKASPLDHPDYRDPLAVLITKQESLYLRRAITQLPDQMRLCLYLYHYHEMKYREIADTMQLEINTVKSHLHQGRLKLKQLLDHGVAQRG